MSNGDLFGLKSKNVVITGALGQLGSSLVSTFTELGANVFSLDIRKASRFYNGDTLTNTLNVDIRNKDETDKAFKLISKECGQIDILINNAGVAFFTHYLERLESEMNEIFDANLKGSLNCILSFIECRNESKAKAAIVNVASIYGLVSPDFRIYNVGDRRSPELYGATKAGIIQMTRYFAVALADSNIRVNSISPGGIYNNENPQSEQFIENYSIRTPMRRMAKVQEIAVPIVFLASDASSYITGQNLIVDGGYTAL